MSDRYHGLEIGFTHAIREDDLTALVSVLEALPFVACTKRLALDSPEIHILELRLKTEILGILSNALFPPRAKP